MATADRRLGRERWRGASLADRHAAFKAVYLAHPQSVRIIKNLDIRLRMQGLSGESTGIVIRCPSDGGKSAFIRYLRRRYPPVEKEDRTLYPIIGFSVPSPCNPLRIANAILEEIHDPDAEGMNAGHQISRARRLFGEAETKIIAIDNFQDVPERRGIKGVQIVGNALRDVIDCNLIAVLLGTDEGDIVVRSNEHPTWLLKTRYTRESLVPGPQYCPHCLAQSGGGYFRTVWRLGFVTVCPIHLCELLDRCPACGAGVWPVGATMPRLFEVDRPTDYLHCARCGFQLSRAPTDRAPEPEDTTWWATSLIAGTPQELAADLSAASVDYLQGLDAICHLFIRNRPRAQIVASSTGWADVASGLVLESGTNQVELLCIEDRRKLIHLARPMLSDWPDAFVDFARRTGLSQEHFSGSEHLMPEWMRKVVYQKLRKQKRASMPVVSAEIQAMQSAGLKVTQQALRERLGGDSKAIRVLLPCRPKANRWEYARFSRRTTSGHQRHRKRQTVALVRNRLHLILAALSGTTLEGVAAMTVREVQAFVDVRHGGATAEERALVVSMGEHWERLSARAVTWGDPVLPFRTSNNTDPARTARYALLKVMRGMKPDLRRDISVFWRRGRPHQV